MEASQDREAEMTGRFISMTASKYLYYYTVGEQSYAKGVVRPNPQYSLNSRREIPRCPAASTEVLQNGTAVFLFE